MTLPSTLGYGPDQGKSADHGYAISSRLLILKGDVMSQLRLGLSIS